MNTFNHLDVTTSQKMVENAGQLGIAIPKGLSVRDWRKLKRYTETLTNAVAMAKWYNVSFERCETILNSIAKLDKLNAGVLDNPSLKQHIRDCLWLAYCKLETICEDNSHYMETIEGIYDNPKKNRRVAKLPDSKLEPEEQWLALELADLFEHSDHRLKFAEPCKPMPRTKCRKAPKKKPPVKPWQPLPITPIDRLYGTHDMPPIKRLFKPEYEGATLDYDKFELVNPDKLADSAAIAARKAKQAFYEMIWGSHTH